ncbi:MAG: ribbon-helix-helix protein, CopG family [Actinomycetales bacterium]|nr:ribbon-helix-helix protein, CopG family [Actinomycetales bacterium]
MTERKMLVQARVPEADARRLDADAPALGLSNRSEAIREGLRLLHRRARHAALARDYDTFYGTSVQAPVSDVAAIGDQLAAEAITGAPAGRRQVLRRVVGEVLVVGQGFVGLRGGLLIRTRSPGRAVGVSVRPI